jgi:flagellar basal body rod protein FlgC
MDIFAIAASGMQAATASLNVAAENIVAAGLQDSGGEGQDAPGATPHQPSRAVQFSLAGGGVGVTVAPQTTEDLGMSLIGLTLALDQFKANVKVFETGDRAMKTLLDLKA